MIRRYTVILAIAKHNKRGRVNVETFLDAFDGGSTVARDKSESPLKAALSATMGGKDTENYGKTLFKKLCKLRANDQARQELRVSMLNRDPDLVGYVTKKDLQRVMDNNMDLTDAEAALLAENVSFTDGSRRNDIDYSLLLLILLEPIARNAQAMTAGATLMKKLMRGADSVSLRRLMSLLFRNFAASDTRVTGMVPSSPLYHHFPCPTSVYI